MKTLAVLKVNQTECLIDASELNYHPLRERFTGVTITEDEGNLTVKFVVSLGKYLIYCEDPTPIVIALNNLNLGSSVNVVDPVGKLLPKVTSTAEPISDDDSALFTANEDLENSTFLYGLDLFEDIDPNMRWRYNKVSDTQINQTKRSVFGTIMISQFKVENDNFRYRCYVPKFLERALPFGLLTGDQKVKFLLSMDIDALSNKVEMRIRDKIWNSFKLTPDEF